MHNTLKRAVIATNQKAQYDAKVKNLLGHKIILAHILTRTVDEFKGMNLSREALFRGRTCRSAY